MRRNVALVLAASPVCWTHYQVMQYPGAALFLGYAARRKLWRLRGTDPDVRDVPLPFAGGRLRSYDERSNSWPDSPWVMYFWTSIPSIASLVLFSLMTRELPEIQPRTMRAGAA